MTVSKKVWEDIRKYYIEELKKENLSQSAVSKYPRAIDASFMDTDDLDNYDKKNMERFLSAATKALKKVIKKISEENDVFQSENSLAAAAHRSLNEIGEGYESLGTEVVVEGGRMDELVCSKKDGTKRVFEYKLRKAGLENIGQLVLYRANMLKKYPTENIGVTVIAEEFDQQFIIAASILKDWLSAEEYKTYIKTKNIKLVF